MKYSDNFSDIEANNSEELETFIIEGVKEDISTLIDVNIGCGPDVYESLLDDVTLLTDSKEENIDFSIDDNNVYDCHPDYEYICA